MRARGGRGVALSGGGLLVVLVLACVVWALGGDPMALLGEVGGTSSGGYAPQAPGPTPGIDPQTDFVARVLGSTEDVWPGVLAPRGVAYAPPTLVLFNDGVDSACGFAQSATGPFYCPPDRKVYIDLAFFRDLDQRFGAPGDFAAAYVIGHEIGHHVQTLLGRSAWLRQQERLVPAAQANQLSVAFELQADCYAGVWAHHANRQRALLEPGDVEEGLGAAAAIGDDRLQRMAGRRIAPERFTHGTSEQRAQWLRAGLTTGNMDVCETFR